MRINITFRVCALLLIAQTVITPHALACRPVVPSTPIVEIAPKALLSVYREAYGHAGFEYVKEERFRNHVQMDFRFALQEFSGKEMGRLSISFDLGTDGNCNPCKVHLMHMNVGNDYSPEQYNVAQGLIDQKHVLAESELARRLGNKIGPTPAMTPCPR